MQDPLIKRDCLASLYQQPSCSSVCAIC